MLLVGLAELVGLVGASKVFFSFFLQRYGIKLLKLVSLAKKMKKVENHVHFFSSFVYIGVRTRSAIGLEQLVRLAGLVGLVGRPRLDQLVRLVRLAQLAVLAGATRVLTI